MHTLKRADGRNSEAITDKFYTQLGEIDRQLYEKDGDDPDPVEYDGNGDEPKSVDDIKAANKVDENARGGNEDDAGNIEVSDSDNKEAEARASWSSPVIEDSGEPVDEPSNEESEK